MLRHLHLFLNLVFTFESFYHLICNFKVLKFFRFLSKKKKKKKKEKKKTSTIEDCLTIYSKLIASSSKSFMAVDQPEVSEHEPPDAAFATKFGSFGEFEAALMAILGHLALDHVDSPTSVPVSTVASRRILVETCGHVVGAASVV